jgi:hypothetical protein
MDQQKLDEKSVFEWLAGRGLTIAATSSGNTQTLQQRSPGARGGAVMMDPARGLPAHQLLNNPIQVRRVVGCQSTFYD